MLVQFRAVRYSVGFGTMAVGLFKERSCVDDKLVMLMGFGDFKLLNLLLEIEDFVYRSGLGRGFIKLPLVESF